MNLKLKPGATRAQLSNHANVKLDMWCLLAWVLAVLQRYVLAHVSKELPELRRDGKWKLSSSKHSGDKVWLKLCIWGSWII